MDLLSRVSHSNNTLIGLDSFAGRQKEGEARFESMLGANRGSQLPPRIFIVLHIVNNNV